MRHRGRAHRIRLFSGRYTLERTKLHKTQASMKIAAAALLLLVACSDKTTQPPESVADAITRAGSVQMDSIYRKVAQDAEVQYGMASRQGDAIQICVQAGLVAAAHLQAQAEDQFVTWKATEKRDCEAAGMPSVQP